MYKYKVSIIMAVYKVEEFLREAIDSVIAQDIGFENIQLILVDDGSPDGSPAICDEYAARYPDNIVVIHKENGGVSTARNAGIERVEGQFVNFLDSDDKLSPNAVREIYDFFVKHLDDIDVVGFPLKFFDGQKGEHILNYKFRDGARIIDMDREWQSPQLSMSSAFVKAECLRKYRFDMRLAYAEDAQFMQKLLAPKAAFGVVPEAIYWYRRRSTGEQSALQTSVYREKWYLPCMYHFHQEMIGFYQERYGYLPRFTQFALMYDMQWRINQRNIPEGIITAEEEAEYRKMIRWVLQHIDDEVIEAQRHMSREHKQYALMLKHGQAQIRSRDNDLLVMYGNHVGTKLSESNCRMEFMNFRQGQMHLEGRIFADPRLLEDISVNVRVDGEDYPAQVLAPESFRVILGEPFVDTCTFRTSIPTQKMGDHTVITVWVGKDGRRINMNRVLFGPFFPVNNIKYQAGYAVRNGWKITSNGNALHLDRISKAEERRCELRFLKELWNHDQVGERKAVIGRILYRILKKFQRKPIWLVGDRAARAGDNGEAFFRYLREHHPEIDSHFIIAKDCPDYQRMAQVGPVLEKDSLKHKMYMLMCDYIFSSQGEIDVFNPFIGYSEPYRDYMAANRFIFLQHGVIHTDLSGWLDRYSKNIYGFVTSAKPEAQSILEYNYHYLPDNVWLTGLPRFDRLYRDEQKQITIMPTWRKTLFTGFSQKTKGWILDSKATQSAYLTFYNGLLNHPRLLEAAAKHGYTIAFFPHPNLQDHLDIFQRNDQVKFLAPTTEYRDVYAKSNLVVSDYSSAIFDFVYLRKPILYCQFDKDEFFSGGHTLGMGYFDYERDGFGEVEYNLEDTVDRIIEYMENGCQMKDEYRRRVDQFFAFDDHNSCQRVYDRVKEMEANR